MYCAALLYLQEGGGGGGLGGLADDPLMAFDPVKSSIRLSSQKQHRRNVSDSSAALRVIQDYPTYNNSSSANSGPL